MERLYTPWRMQYIAAANQTVDGCIFCALLADDAGSDRENFIVYRAQTTFVVMNIYPYNTGHLMVLPFEHAARLSALPAQTQLEMMTISAYCTELLTELMDPDGFNIGLNLGRAGGAGVDSHLHLHIVPRWTGDSNFMTVIGETRVLPETLTDTYDRIMALIEQRPPDLPTR